MNKLKNGFKNGLKKGKHYLLMHPETVEESPLEIMTSKCVTKGEIYIMREDSIELRPNVQKGPVYSEMGISFKKKGPIAKAEPV